MVYSSDVFFTSSVTEATLRRTAPYIPSDSNVHSHFERVLAYAGLGRHLNRDSAHNCDRDGVSNDSNDTCDESLAGDECLIDGAFVSSIMNSMRSHTQRTANTCANDARRIKDALTKDKLAPVSIEAIMVALGFSRDCAGTELSDGEKKNKLIKWIKSITNCALVESKGEDLDVSTHSSDSSSSKVVRYKTPYDILNAIEIKSLLMRRVGSASVATGKVPRPNPNPTKVDQRRETLWWLAAHPDQSKRS